MHSEANPEERYPKLNNNIQARRGPTEVRRFVQSGIGFTPELFQHFRKSEL